MGTAGLAYRREAETARVASWAPVALVVTQLVGLPAAPFRTHVPVAIAMQVLGLGGAAAIITLMVWQHRSASTARLLGYPARVSPAWGAWSWVVPIVDLVVPYLAVRDLLPATTGHRPLVRRWWAWQVASLIAAFTAIAARVTYFATHAVVPAWPTVVADGSTVLAVPAALLARRIVISVTAQHGAGIDLLPVAPPAIPPPA